MTDVKNPFGNRREFPSQAAAATGTLILGAGRSAQGQQQPTETETSQMIRRYRA
jgi:hypothetical protein